MCTSSLAPVWWGAIVRHLLSSLEEPAPFQGAAVPGVGGTFIAEDEAMQHSYHFLSVPSNQLLTGKSVQLTEAGAPKLETSLSDQVWRKRRLCCVIGILDKTPIDLDESVRMPNSADFWCHLSGLFFFCKDPFVLALYSEYSDHSYV